MNALLRSLLLMTAISNPLTALAAEMIDVRRAEKISLSLTGMPLSAENRAAVLKGTMTKEALAEQLSKSPAFIEKFGQFWTQVLGIQLPIDIFSLRTKNGVPSTLDGQGRYVLSIGGVADSQYTSEKLQSVLKNFQNRTDRIALNIVQCDDAPMIIGAVQNIDEKSLQKIVDAQATANGPILPGTLQDWKNLTAFYRTFRTDCADDTPRVKPYWDPKEVTILARYKGVETYKVSPEILKKCGAAIEKCNIADAKASDRYSNFVSRDVTMEPGYIIGHTVAEDRPWPEVLTTPTTIVTGTYAEWLTNKGAPLWENFPSKSYEGSTDAIFTKPDIYDRKHYRVQRNALHSGVLTTIAYQLVTNGRRAKANRAYESFLCQKFSVPDGANPDPNDANPDLTKRTYCSFCHKTLEPMAAFWNRWPDTGTLNYIYNTDAKIVDTGAFNGGTGPGAAAFGKALVSSQAFQECGIKRAFEFVNGRKMTAAEADANMSEWMSQYDTAQQNLRPLIKSMVLAPEFLGSDK